MKITQHNEAGSVSVIDIWEGELYELLQWQDAQWERERAQSLADRFDEGILAAEGPEAVVPMSKRVFREPLEDGEGHVVEVTNSDGLVPDPIIVPYTPGVRDTIAERNLQEAIDPIIGRQIALRSRKEWKAVEDHSPPRTGAVLQARFPHGEAEIVWTTRDVPANFEGQWVFNVTDRPIDEPFTHWRHRPMQVELG